MKLYYTTSKSANGLLIFALVAIIACTTTDQRVNKTYEPTNLLPQGSEKFLGNIIGGTTGDKGIVEDTIFAQYWNQITPGNVGKHGQVEHERDQYKWHGLDYVQMLAQKHDLVFKHHAFVFDHGNYALKPWLKELSADEIREEVEEWIVDYFQRYPDTEIVDVVNEALQSVVDERVRMALGGDEEDQWIRWVFEKARKHAPKDCLLLINEYSVLNDSARVIRYKELVQNLMKDGNLDAIGLQGHALEKIDAQVLKQRMDALASTGLPIHITEYDIDEADDATQKIIMAAQFPVFWEHPAVAGVTFWGYKEGETWIPSSCLILKDGTERPAMQWLRGYLKENPDGLRRYKEVL